MSYTGNINPGVSHPKFLAINSSIVLVVIVVVVVAGGHPGRDSVPGRSLHFDLNPFRTFRSWLEANFMEAGANPAPATQMSDYSYYQPRAETQKT